MFGVQNFWNVMSNLPFLIIGLAGVSCFVIKRPRTCRARTAWAVLFFGVLTFVAFGSAWYHSQSQIISTLVWDRLPMAVGFMGLFVALL